MIDRLMSITQHYQYSLGLRQYCNGNCQSSGLIASSRYFFSHQMYLSMTQYTGYNDKLCAIKVR